jgi:hypothetical protein
MKEIEQKQAQSEQMAMQQASQQIDPKQALMMQAQAEVGKTQQKREAASQNAQVQLTKIATDDAVKNKLADIEMIKVLAQVQGADAEVAIKQESVDAENARTAVNMAIDVSKHHHDVAQAGKEHDLKKQTMETKNATSKGTESKD